MMLAIGLSYNVLMLRYIPSIPSFLRDLSWSCVESYQWLLLRL
jgi:hypothetical protein